MGITIGTRLCKLLPMRSPFHWLPRPPQRSWLPAVDAPVTLVDYGSSSGRDPIGVQKAAFESVRSTGGNQHIVLIHNDQHNDDFEALFHNISKTDC